MELRHFEYFVAVAEERGFTRAAARLHVVQSGVSAVIKSLERELGAPLLVRTSKKVELTDAGTALLPRARAALDAARAARDAVDEVRGGLRGTVRVGALIGVGGIDVPTMVGEFHRDHPAVGLHIRVSPNGSVGLLQGLADGELDLAIVSVPGRAPAGIRVIQSYAEEMILLLPGDHRLAGAGEIRIEDLGDEKFVDSPLGYGNRTVVDRAFTVAGIGRHVAIEVTDLSGAADFIRQGLGVAIVPPSAIADRTGLVTKKVAGADLEWPAGVAISELRAPSAAAKALFDLILRRLV